MSGIGHEATELQSGLGSRVGRRIFALFVGCSLLPLALFAYLALDEVSARLSEDADRQLRQAAKSSGVTLAERLLLLKTDLELAASEVARYGDDASTSSPAELRSRLAGRFETLFVQRGSRQVSLHGHAVELPELSEAQRVHLAGDKALLLTLPRSEGTARIVMLRRLGLEIGEECLLAGVIRDEQLWEVEGVRPGDGQLLVRDAAGHLLFESKPGLFPRERIDQMLRREPSAGGFAWSNAEGDWLGRYWRLFIRPRFDVDWIVSHARGEERALATLRSWQWVFVWTAVLSFLVVTALSLALIRKTLGPILQLREATRRVARGELDSKVSIETNDEFAELGESFNQMTRELLEHKRELVHARDEALAAARVEAELVSNVSHELRTPLTSILSFAEILQQFGDEDAATRAEFLGIILEQAQHLDGIVTQMLKLSRLSNGEEYWNEGHVDVERWLVETVAEFPEEQRRRVRMELAAELPPVLGDAAHLTHVWHHLIDNALKFSDPASAVCVRVATQGAELLFEVEDHGVGIDPAHHGVIFERFRQVERDYMTEKAAGTGLGLALVRDVVLRHRGRITVESERGAGAVFRVWLPLAQEPAAC